MKKLSTPLAGGASAIGFVVSITGLPARFAGPAARSTSAAALPLAARTTTSPKLGGVGERADAAARILRRPLLELGRVARPECHLVAVFEETRTKRLRDYA